MSEKKTFLKLSEAIRLGAMLRPQIHDGTFLSGKGSCALGAAGEAIGGWCDDSARILAMARWTWIFNTVVQCPNGMTKFTSSVDQIIYLLNDGHKWTRERIADWVATIEPQQEEKFSPLVRDEEILAR